MAETAPDRIPCVVVGCRRTAPRSKYPGEHVVIICGKCWRLASRTSRRRIRHVERIMRREGVTGWQDSKPNTVGRKAVFLHSKMFDRIVREATEAKMGIG